MIKHPALTSSALLITLTFSLFNCTQKHSTETADETVEHQTPALDGKQLSIAYCATCHKYPEPDLLDKKSWEEYMLPRMGYLLGIYKSKESRDSLIEAGEGGKLVEEAQIFPKTRLVPEKEWEKIRAYYLENAPLELPKVPKKEITIGLEGFKVHTPEFKISPPSSTMAKFSKDGKIYIGDAFSQSLVEFDHELNYLKKGKVKEGAVWLEEQKEDLWLTIMGSFSPTDAPEGFILTFPKGGAKTARVPIKNLRRPVHSSFGDLNNNGKQDLVVSEFGKWTGRLSLFKNMGEKGFNQQVLIDHSGATKSYLHDFNQDGLLDIIALFGQGNESIYILYNKGNYEFERKRVLQFSPSNGSSFFDLVDFNGDGFLDIIYTAGDNADFKPVTKPYHGVYVFENDGKNNFEQSFFYQLNGAYGAVAKDFDLDGDIDIAAISFFPDYKNSPEESFVLLTNHGKEGFKASTFENNTRGRWIVMDAGDPDHDGDIDLILGSLAFEIIPKNEALMTKWIRGGIPFVYLENTSR